MRLLRRKTGGRSSLLRLAAAVALTTTMIGIGGNTASATNIAGIFQLDGNPQDADLATAPDDWQTLMSSTAKDVGFVASTAIPVADSDSPTDVTYFTGGGSKDVREISAWQYSSGDVAPDKDEILNAAAAGYKLDTDADGKKELVVFFTADRFADDGDSQIGFWFFGNSVAPDGSGGFTGSHKTGDILVLSDFSQGGTVSTVNVYEWVGGKNPLQHLTQGTGSVDCGDASHNPYACAVENHGDTSALWSYTPKSGSTGTYPQGSFLEGGINVTKLLGGSSACFASFLAETRSSTSTTAQLKDFASGSFPVCAPKTTLSISASPAGPYHAGDPVVFTYSDTNSGTGPLSSATVSDPKCTTAVVEKTSGGYNVGDTNTNGAFDVGETWQWTCSMGATADTHTATADAIDTNFNSVHVTYCTDPSTPPTGVYCSQGERATITLTLIAPSTKLTVTQSATIVHSGDSVTFTYKEKNDGDSDITNSPYAIGVTDDKCSPVTASTTTYNGDTYNVGDANHDGILNQTEEWTFTCTKSVTATETHTATATGTDSAGANVTYSSSCTSSATLVCDPDEQAQVTVTVINPGTQLTINASAVVTYTFFEENKGDVPLTNVSVDSSLVGCTSPATPDLVTYNGNQYNSGDTNHNNKLDVGEKWKFSCTGPALTWKTGDADAVQSNTGTGHGYDTSDVSSGGADVTYGSGCVSSSTKVCDSREQTSVTVTISG